MAVLDVQAVPFWAVAQKKLTDDLAHPQPQFKRTGGLMARLEARTITRAERLELHALLEIRSTSNDPLVTELEKMKAALLIGVMQLVLNEADWMRR